MMALFPYDELKHYSFGLRAGLSNLATNGLALGIKKTVGKITQPINWYTRFPEYYFFEQAMRGYLGNTPVEREVRILDVGSPKLLGLYLAFKMRAEVMLTDISSLNVDEYRTMWRGLAPKARGKALFALQDARELRLGEGEFDIVYSMSVLEHIEGESGDGRAVEELLRVLKPGGLLLLSVPFGSRYTEQQMVGMVGAVRRTHDGQAHFFQRIYDRAAFEERILKHAPGLEQVVFTTVWRTRPWMGRAFGALGENLRGALGFLQPPLSALSNRSRSGVDTDFAVAYGNLHSARDVHGDLILAGRKPRPQP